MLLFQLCQCYWLQTSVFNIHLWNNGCTRFGKWKDDTFAMRQLGDSCRPGYVAVAANTVLRHTDNSLPSTMAGRIVPLSFPSTRSALWDHHATGPPITLHYAQQRGAVVSLQEKSLRLMHRFAEDSGTDRYTCMLVGSVYCQPDTDGITVDIDRFAPDKSIADVDSALPGELLVPCLVERNGAKPNGSVDDLCSSLKALHQSMTAKRKLDLAHALRVRAHCGYHDNATHTSAIFHVDMSVVLPSATLRACPIRPIPVMTTALSKNLSGPANLNETQAEPKAGYLTMEQTRKLLLVLPSDPKVNTLPLVGIWVSSVSSVRNPFVWLSCLRYLHNASLRDRVCVPPEPFLILLYSTQHAQPLFYDCMLPAAGVVSGGGSSAARLTFELSTCHDVLQLPKNGVGRTADSPLDMELSLVENGAKRDMFDAALEITKDTLNGPASTDVSHKAEQNEDMPWSSPEPHSTKELSTVRPSVPEVSLLFDENDDSLLRRHLTKTSSDLRSALKVRFALDAERAPLKPVNRVSEPSATTYMPPQYMQQYGSYNCGGPWPPPWCVGGPQTTVGAVVPGLVVPQKRTAAAKKVLRQQQMQQQFQQQQQQQQQFLQQQQQQQQQIRYQQQQLMLQQNPQHFPQQIPQQQRQQLVQQQQQQLGPQQQQLGPQQQQQLGPHQQQLGPQQQLQPFVQQQLPMQQQLFTIQQQQLHNRFQNQQQPPNPQLLNQQLQQPLLSPQQQFQNQQQMHQQQQAQLMHHQRTPQQQQPQQNQPPSYPCTPVSTPLPSHPTPQPSTLPPSPSRRLSISSSPAVSADTTDSGMHSCDSRLDSSVTSSSETDVYEMLRRQDVQLRQLRQQLAQLMAKQTTVGVAAVSSAPPVMTSSASQVTDAVTAGPAPVSSAPTTQESIPKTSSPAPLSTNSTPRTPGPTPLSLSSAPTTPSSTPLAISSTPTTDTADTQPPMTCSVGINTSVWWPDGGQVGSESADHLHSSLNQENTVHCNDTTANLAELQLTFIQDENCSMESEFMVDIPDFPSMSPDKATGTCSDRSTDYGNQSPLAIGDSVSVFCKEAAQVRNDDANGIKPEVKQLLYSDQKLFYENLMGNVNRLLANRGDNSSLAHSGDQSADVTHERTHDDGSSFRADDALRDRSVDVIAETKRQLCRMGVDLSRLGGKEKSTYRVSDSSSYFLEPALLPHIHYASLMLDSDSDLSTRADALAVKYLNDSQLTQLAAQRGSNRVVVPEQSFSGGADKHMSFASRKYMQRYGLVSGGVARDDNREGNVSQLLRRLADRSHAAVLDSPVLGGNLNQKPGVAAMSQDSSGSFHAFNGPTSTPAAAAAGNRKLINGYGSSPLTKSDKHTTGRVLDIERLKELPKLL